MHGFIIQFCIGWPVLSLLSADLFCFKRKTYNFGKQTFGTFQIKGFCRLGFFALFEPMCRDFCLLQ